MKSSLIKKLIENPKTKVPDKAVKELFEQHQEMYEMLDRLIGNYQEVASVLEHDGFKTSYLDDAKAVDALLSKARGEV